MEDSSQTRDRWWIDTRILISIVVTTGAFSVGAFKGIIGPTLVDLKEKFCSSYGPLARSLMVWAISIVLGSYITGFVYTSRRRWMNAYLGTMLLIGAAAIAAVPWSPSLVWLSALYVIVGWVAGAVRSGVKLYTLGMWGRSSPVPYYLMSSGIPFGKACVALIAAPFLAVHTNYATNSGLCEIQNASNLCSLHNNCSSDTSKLYIPFTVNSCIGLVGTLGFLAIAVRQEPATSLLANKTVLNTENTGAARKFILPLLLISAHTWISIRQSLLVTYYLSITYESDLALPKSSGSILLFLMLISTATSQVILVLFKRWVKLTVTLILQLALGTASVVVFTFWGLRYLWVLWLFTPLHAFFLGPIRATLVTMTNNCVEIEGYTMALIDTGTSIGLFVATWIGGATMDRGGPQFTLYVWLGTQYAVVLFSLAVMVMTVMLGDRFADHGCGQKEEISELLKGNKLLNDEGP